MMLSPCYRCERKNYAAGCSVGCEAYAAHRASEDARKRKEILQHDIDSVLIEGKLRARKAMRVRCGR